METNALHVVVSFSSVLETVWERILAFLLGRRNVEIAALPISSWSVSAWADLHGAISSRTPRALQSRLHHDVLRLVDLLACEQLVLTTEILIQLCMLPFLWDNPPADSIFQTLRVSRNRIVHQAAFQRLAADSARLLMFRIAETLGQLSDGISGSDASAWTSVLEQCKVNILSMTTSPSSTGGRAGAQPMPDKVALTQQFEGLETQCKLLVRNAKSTASSSEVESPLSYLRCAASLLLQHGQAAVDTAMGKRRYTAQKVLLALAQESTSSFGHLKHDHQLPLLAMLRAVLVSGPEGELHALGASGHNSTSTSAAGFAMESFFKPSMQAALDPTLLPSINVEKRYSRVSGLGCLLSAVQLATERASAAVPGGEAWLHKLVSSADIICAPLVSEHVDVVQAVNPWPLKVAVQDNNDHVRSLLGLLSDVFSARQHSALSTSSAALTLPRTIADLENKPFRTTAEFVVHVLVQAWAQGLHSGDAELCSAAGRCLKVACGFTDVALALGKPHSTAGLGTQQPLEYMVATMEDAVVKARRALHRLSDHYLLLKEAVDLGAGGGNGPWVQFAHAVMEPVVRSGEGCLPTYLRESLHSARCLLAHARSSFSSALLSALPRSLMSVSHGQACLLQQLQLQGTRIYALLTMNSFEQWTRSTLIDDKVARDEFWVAKKLEEKQAEMQQRAHNAQNAHEQQGRRTEPVRAEELNPSVAALFGFSPGSSATPVMSADDIESALFDGSGGAPTTAQPAAHSHQVRSQDSDGWTPVINGAKSDAATTPSHVRDYIPERSTWEVLSDHMQGRSRQTVRSSTVPRDSDDYDYEEEDDELIEEEDILEAQDDGDWNEAAGGDDGQSELADGSGSVAGASKGQTGSSIGPSATELQRTRMLGRGTGKLHDLTDAFGRDLNYVPVNALIDDLRRHVALWSPNAIKLCIVLPAGAAGVGSGTAAVKGGGGGPSVGQLGASSVDELMKIINGALLQELHRHIMDWLWTCEVSIGTQAYSNKGTPEGAPLTFEAQTAKLADEGKPTLVNVRYVSFETWLVDRIAGGPHKQTIEMEIPLSPYTRPRPELPMGAVAKARAGAIQGRQESEPSLQKLLPDVFRFCDALDHIRARLTHYDSEDMGASFAALGKAQTAVISAKALPLGKSNSGGSTASHASTLSQSSRGANGRGVATHNPATEGMRAVEIKQVRSIVARVCRESAILLSFNDAHAGYRT